MKALTTALLVALSGCRCPKPPAPPPAPPPQIVEITRPCLDPLPELPEVHLPKVAPDAIEITIDAANYRAISRMLILLVDYTMTQQEKCGVKRP